MKTNKVEIWMETERFDRHYETYPNEECAEIAISCMLSRFEREGKPNGFVRFYTMPYGTNSSLGNIILYKM